MIANLLDFITAPTNAGAAAMLLVKSTLVMSMGLALWLVLRQASASARHLVLGATLIALLLLPAISAVAPALPVPLLDRPLTVPTSVPALDRTGETLPGIAAESAVLESGLSSSQQSTTQRNFYLFAYVSVAGAILAYLLLGVGRVWWLSRRATNVTHSSKWQPVLARHNRLAAHVLSSAEVDAPMTWGVFRPLIVMPAAAAHWSDTDKRHALLHEIAHVERKDWLMQFVGRVICAVYWFNPLVWITLRQLVLEAELAADDRVLESGAVPDDYAEQLVALTRDARASRLPIAATTMAERSMLRRRVHSILDSGDRKMSVNHLSRYTLLTIVSLTAMIIGSATLVAAPQDAGEEQPLSVSNDISTPLIRAAARGDNDEVLRLLRAGADVNEISENRGRNPQLPRSALTAAAAFGHIDVVRTLLDAGAPVDRVVSGDETALIAATRRNHIEITRLLIERGADANLAVQGDGSPLIAATIANNAEAVRLLLQRGADPDMSVRGDENPLYHAAENGNDEILGMLIDAGVDVNQEWPGDGTPLIVATRAGNQSAVEALMLAGARPDQGVERDGNAMIVAAQNGDTALLQKMIATGADVNASVEGDGSPLIQAARNGHMEAVVLLLQSGANIDKVVAGDENALIGAAWKGDVEMVDYLLRSGANPNIKARSHGETRTALRQASLAGHEKVVRMLQDAGATE